MRKEKKKIKSASEIKTLYNQIVLAEANWRNAIRENIKAIGSVRIKDDEEECSGLLIRGTENNVMRIDSIRYNKVKCILEIHIISIEGKLIEHDLFEPLGHLETDMRDYVYENIIWPL